MRSARHHLRAVVHAAVLAAIGVVLWSVVADAQSPSRSRSNSRVANVVQAVRRSYERRPPEWRRRTASCLPYLDEAESFHNQGVAYFEDASRARSSPEQTRLVRLGNEAIAERQRLIGEFWACTRRMNSGDVFNSNDPPRRDGTPPDPNRPSDSGPPFDPGPPAAPPSSERTPPTRTPENPPLFPPGFPLPPAEAAPRRSPGRRQPPMPVIVALGDSITAGYRLRPLEAWPEVLQGLLQRGGDRFQVMNKGEVNDTARGARGRLASALLPNTRILIVAIGLNDFKEGRAIPAIRADIAAIIEAAQRRNIDVLLCGFEAPPLRSAQDQALFVTMFRELAAQYRVRRLPNLVVEIWNEEGLTLPDGIHPNVAGAQRIGELVYRHIRLMLRASGSSSTR
jgi:acyl-CoA thioesterase-1